MPYKPARQCRNKRCPGVTTDASGYCEKCKPLYVKQGYREWDKNRPTSAERGYDRNWSLFRKMYLRAHPICDRCGQPSYIPHHKIALKNGGDKYEESNLMPLCFNCHEIVEGRKHE